MKEVAFPVTTLIMKVVVKSMRKIWLERGDEVKEGWLSEMIIVVSFIYSIGLQKRDEVLEDTFTFRNCW